MKVGRRLTLGFAVVVVCVFAAIALSLTLSGTIREKFSLLEEDIVPGTIAMGDMDGAALYATQELIEYILHGQAENRENIETAMRLLNKAGLKHARHERHIGAEERKAAQKILSTIDRFASAVEETIALKDAGAGLDELLEMKQRDVHPAVESLMELLRHHKAVHLEELAAAGETVGNAHTLLVRASLVVGVLIVALAIVSASVTTRSIVKPLHALHKGAEIIGLGDLDYKVATCGKDEIGQLSRAFDEMTENLKHTTTSIARLEQEVDRRRRTEQQLEEKHAFLKTVLDSLTYPFYIIDVNDYTVRLANAAANIGDLAGKVRCYELDHMRDEPCQGPDYPCPIEQVKTTGKSAIVQHLHYDKDCRPKHIEVHAYPIFDEEGKVSQIIKYSLDVTERKLAEERQAKLMSELESVNNELKDFAYVVSHDLKAPLRGIKALADWISTDYGDKFDEEGAEQMALLVNRVDRMHNLIDGILQYSRLGRVMEEQEEIDLNKLIPGVIDMVSAPENIEITADENLPTITCERTRITQIFENLLSNAVKYMDKPEGRIHTGCSDDGDFWKFSISDNGPGIEQQHFERVFRIFQTLQSRDEFESTGVGLTLVKKIVEQYGGKVRLESEPGKGATFYFTLPKQIVVQSAEPTETAEIASAIS